MDDTEFRLWASKINELTEPQVANLNQRLKILGKGSGSINGTAPLEPADDWLFDGMYRALKSKGITSPSAIYAVKKTKGYKRYLADAPNVIHELELLLKDSRNSTSARMSLALLIGNVLIRWCEKKRLPLTAATIFSMVCHAREALEMQFPGYIASNLFHIVYDGISPVADNG